MNLFIAPSILAADFGNLNGDMKTVEPDVDFFHVDVMDGHFVPNITFGPPAIEQITTGLPLDCHLMIEHPEKYVERFADAVKKHKRPFEKCYIVVHAEACKDPKAVVGRIKKTGLKAGFAINPDTPASAFDPVLDMIDLALVMSVHPGFGGQKFIPEVLPKIKELRAKKPNLDIEIDGGINDKTAKLAKEAGANILVAGSYIFRSQNRLEAIDKLRK